MVKENTMKQTEIGLMPEDWRVVFIKQMAPLQRGFDLPISKIQEGVFPVVFSNGINKHHNQFMVKAPGIVTGRSGTIGKVFYIERNFWPHNTSLFVTAFNNVNPKYVYFLYNYIDFNKFSSGSGVPTLNRNDIHDTKIPLPPLPEQEAIAEALSDADAWIESLKQLIAKKRLIKHGSMQELLTPKEDWKVKKLGELLQFGSGKDYKHLNSGDIPVYGTGGVMTFVDNYLYDGISIGIGRKGTIDKPVLLSGKFWTVDTLFYTHSFSGINPNYIYYQFLLIPWREYNEASGVPSLNKNTLEQIEIKIPSLTEQARIATILSDMDAELGALGAQLGKARQVKQGMMQELLTGRVRLI
ncbi:MAG: restriction endonuclease subunit S [Pedobacter sp.]|nr:restriction endonuclease subunit S [Pedobacter sp.]